LSDGATRGTPGELIDFIAAMKKEQAITVSTIAVSADADIRLMKRIASEGGGSYQFFCNPSFLPQITLDSVLNDGASFQQSEETQKCN
jgi:hypothetical protein